MMSEVSRSFCPPTPWPNHEISLLILISTNHQILSHHLSPLSPAKFLALQYQFLFLEAQMEEKLWYKAPLGYPEEMCMCVCARMCMCAPVHTLIVSQDIIAGT